MAQMYKVWHLSTLHILRAKIRRIYYWHHKFVSKKTKKKLGVEYNSTNLNLK
jgi:hypothetical protein